MNINTNFQDAAGLRRIQEALWAKGEGTRASVMVGAGFSRLALRAAANMREPPLWSDFTREMTRSLYPNVDNDVSHDPLRLAQEFEAVHGRAGIDGLIRSLIRDGEWQPSDYHDRLVMLPWGNVLTTNWDTLLERAALRSLTRSYEIVRSVEDIPHTSSPRIVKLHGSLPSNTPFIFTEEDYRTYPRRFAPFVNLAQHVMMESVCCLVGFSGSDPNFLEWSGWVRDNLGRNAPTIYLVGALGLSSSQRRMLEARNVCPVDLSPLLKSTDRSQRHVEAISLFLERLEAAEPKPEHHWPASFVEMPEIVALHKLSDNGDAVVEKLAVQAVLPMLEEIRLSYPGWVVTPGEARLQVEYSILPWKPVNPDALLQLSVRERHRLIFELAWLHDVALIPLAVGLRDSIVEILRGSHPPELTEAECTDLTLQLVQDARERNDACSFDEWIKTLEAKSPSDHDHVARIIYERCLLARDQLSYEELGKLIDRLDGDDPMWLIRKASLLSELGDYERAYAAVREAIQSLRQRRSAGSKSIWLDARFAWSSLLARTSRFRHGSSKLKNDSAVLEDERLQARFVEIRSEPWAILRSMVDQLRKRQDEILKQRPTAKSLFDTGHYQLAQETIEFGTIHDLPRVGRRLVDRAGVPDSINSVLLPARQIRQQCVGLDSARDVFAVLRAISTIDNHNEPLVEAFFNRISVAQLDQSIAEAVSDALFVAVRFSIGKIRSDQSPGSTFWISRLRTHLEIASRIVVRLPNTKSIAWFELGLEFAALPECSAWWLFEPLGHLIARSLEPLEADAKRALTLNIFKFPLQSERKILGPERDWPEPSKFLKSAEVDRSGDEREWSICVQQLIEAVRNSDRLSRTNAAIRLLALHSRDQLTPDEAKSFSDSLWSRIDSATNLPADSELLPHVYVELDSSKAVAVEKYVRAHREKGGPASYSDAFVQEVLGLTSIFRRMKAPISLRLDDALALADLLLKKTAEEVSHSEQTIGFGVQQHRREVATKVGLLFADGLLPVMTNTPEVALLIERILTAIEAGRSDHLIPCLPEVMKLAPHEAVRVSKLLRHSLKSGDEQVVRLAFEGVIRWLSRMNAPGMQAPAEWLKESIASHISFRRRPGLYEALLCALTLIKERQLTSTGEGLVLEGLSFLLEETRYEKFSGDDLSARAVTLEREQCVMIAHEMILLGRQDEVLTDWIRAGQADPLPEVRLAANGRSSTNVLDA